MAEVPKPCQICGAQVTDGTGQLCSTCRNVDSPGQCQCGHGHGFTRCPNYGGVAEACHYRGCSCVAFKTTRVRDLKGES